MEIIDRKAVEDINNEGFYLDRMYFNGDDNSGAAVLVGKKEDMPTLLNNLETAGRYADLETYISNHKEIIVPREEIYNPEMINFVDNYKGFYWMEENYGEIIQYVDGRGNISEVKIDPRKVSSLGECVIKEEEYCAASRSFEDGTKLNQNKAYHSIQEELKNLGFTQKLSGDGDAIMPGYKIEGLVREHKRKAKEDEENSRKSQFRL